MEGGFSKVLLITTEDGMEVVAKILCPNAERAKYSTASEAAVFQYGMVSFPPHTSGLKLKTWGGSSELKYNNTCSENSGVECKSLEPDWCWIHYHGKSSGHSAFQNLGWYHRGRPTWSYQKLDPVRESPCRYSISYIWQFVLPTFDFKGIGTDSSRLVNGSNLLVLCGPCVQFSVDRWYILSWYPIRHQRRPL